MPVLENIILLKREHPHLKGPRRPPALPAAAPHVPSASAYPPRFRHCHNRRGEAYQVRAARCLQASSRPLLPRSPATPNRRDRLAALSLTPMGQVVRLSTSSRLRRRPLVTYTSTTASPSDRIAVGQLVTVPPASLHLEAHLNTSTPQRPCRGTLSACAGATTGSQTSRPSSITSTPLRQPMSRSRPATTSRPAPPDRHPAGPQHWSPRVGRHALGPPWPPASRRPPSTIAHLGCHSLPQCSRTRCRGSPKPLEQHQQRCPERRLNNEGRK